MSPVKIDVDNVEIITDEDEEVLFQRPTVYEDPLKKEDLNETFFLRVVDWIYSSFYEIMK